MISSGIDRGCLHIGPHMGTYFRDAYRRHPISGCGAMTGDETAACPDALRPQRKAA
jgi:hypothetical protein